MSHSAASASAASPATDEPAADTQSAADFLRTLDQVENGVICTVQRVVASNGMPESARWLTEIGFVPGERVRVLDRAWPGGDPLKIRVGDSTFALRRWEAACIEVRAGSAPGTGQPAAARGGEPPSGTSRDASEQ